MFPSLGKETWGVKSRVHQVPWMVGQNGTGLPEVTVRGGHTALGRVESRHFVLFTHLVTMLGLNSHLDLAWLTGY